MTMDDNLLYEHLLAYALLGSGVITIYLVNTRCCNVWLRLAVTVICLSAVRDLSLAPIFADFADIPTPLYLSFDGYRSDRVIGMLLVASSYTLILMGIKLGLKKQVCQAKLTFFGRLSPEQAKRMMVISVYLFGIGMLGELYVMRSVLATGLDLTEVASTRAIFSDEATLGDALFSYARYLSRVTVVGALGMLAVASGRLTLTLVVTAIFIYLGFEVVFGGRLFVATLVLCFSVLYIMRFGYTLTKGIAITVASAIVILVVMFLRLDTATMDGAIVSIAANLFGANYPRVDQAAWAYFSFLNPWERIGMTEYLAKFLGLIPGASWDGATSLWQTVVNTFYGGVSYHKGRGGENYATSAELYAHGGLIFMSSVTFVFGWIVGKVVSFISEVEQLPPIVILAILVIFLVVLRGGESRLDSHVIGFGPIFLSTAVMTAYIQSRGAMLIFLALVFLLLSFFLMWKMVDADFMKFLPWFTFALMYTNGLAVFNALRRIPFTSGTRHACEMR